jgi:cytochrome P450
MGARPPGPVVPGWTRAITYLSPVRLPFDSLTYVTENAAKYGGLFGIYLGDTATYVVSDPALAHELLVTRASEFHKAAMIRHSIGGLVGNGLLTSEDDFWKRQRKLAQPAFHARRIEAYAEAMIRATTDRVATWQVGETRDIAHETMAITLDIVCKTLFDIDVRDQTERVGRLTAILLEAANDRLNSYEPIWEQLFKRRQTREDAAHSELFALIDAIIAEHRTHGQDNGDLLSMLLAARDDDGQPMSEKQLRDEVMTLFVAGHETTANLMAWTLYLLDQNRDAQTRYRAELAGLSDAPLSLSALRQLPYGEQILKEAMRLYPPAAGATRENIAPISFGGYDFPARSQFAISSYAMHRDPALFPEPLAFKPGRFSPENEPSIPKYAYLPFGAGPRVCIGNSFAMLEAQLILAAILRRFTLSLAPGQKIQAEQLFTVRPRGGIRMQIAAA